MDFSVQLHTPRMRLFKFLGQGAALQFASRIALPFPCSDRSASRRHQPSQPRHFLSSAPLVRRSDMLDRGLTSPGLTLSQNKSVVVASHTHLLRAVRRELLEQGLSFEGALLCVTWVLMRMLGTEDRSRFRTRGSRNVAKGTRTSKFFRMG